MLFIERRHEAIIIQICLLFANSDKDVGVMLDRESFFMEPLRAKGFKDDEIAYTLRFLVEEGYFNPYPNSSENLMLTSKGFKWIKEALKQKPEKIVQGFEQK